MINKNVNIIKIEGDFPKNAQILFLFTILNHK